MMHKVLAFTALLCLIASVAAIHNCGSAENSRRFLEANPEEEAKMSTMRQAILENARKQVKKSLHTREAGNDLRIPVVWHILFDGSLEGSNIQLETIISEMEFLNQWYSATNENYGSTSAFWSAETAVTDDFKISFELASFDQNGFETSGVERQDTSLAIACDFNDDIFSTDTGGLDIWDSAFYMNIYTCELTSPGLGGYANFPFQRSSGNTDGIVLAYDQINTDSSGALLAHEVGHWLGLDHTFVQQSCDEIGDYVDDTPKAHNNAISAFGAGCPGFQGKVDGDFISECEGVEEVMVQNIMDYNFDQCITFFSKGQTVLMRSFLQSGFPRSTLASSPGLSKCNDYDCSDKNCGADGCGGFCGECNASSECNGLQVCEVIPAANQECDTSIEIIPAPGDTVEVTGDNTGATTSAAPFNVCTIGDESISISSSLWYHFTATETGTHVVDTNARGVTNMNTVISIWGGDCADPTCITVDDGRDSDNFYYAEVSFEAVKDTRYIIGLSEDFSSSGPFGLSLTSPASTVLEPLEITGDPTPLAIECSDTGSFDSWIAENGGATVSEGCGNVVFTNDFVAPLATCAETVVSFTATDSCGATVTYTSTVTTTDSFGPFVNSARETGTCAEYLTYLQTVEGVDNCDAPNLVVITGEIVEGCGTTVLTATDSCGNSQVSSISYTIVDDTVPTFTTLPEPLVVECNEDSDVTIGEWSDLFAGTVAEHDCGEVTLSIDIDSEDQNGCALVQNYIVTATSICGASTSTGTTLTVEDNAGPEIESGPFPLEISCEDVEDILPIWLANGAEVSISDACSSVNLIENNFESVSPCGEASVQFTAFDDCGNETMFTSTVTTTDTEAPTFQSEANDVTMECNTNEDNTFDAEFAAFLESVGDADYSDNCSLLEDLVVTREESSANGSCPSSIDVVFTITDVCGNPSTTEASFIVTDSRSPQIVISPENFDGECTEFEAWLESSGGAQFSDACTTDGDLFLTRSEITPGECSGTLDFTATDLCGNQISIDATYAISDTVLPIFTTLPEPLVVECGEGNYGTFVEWRDSFAGAVAEHPCGEAELSIVDEGYERDGCNLITEYTVTATAVCGGSVSETTTVTNQDTTAPVIESGPIALTIPCEEINTTFLQWLEDGAEAEISDNCNSSDRIENNFDEVDTTLSNCGEMTVEFTAFDNCGNETTFSSIVTTTDSEAPTFVSEPVRETVECDNNTDNAAIDAFEAFLENNGGAVATDNCAGEIIYTSAVEFSDGVCPAINSVVFTATDACGNAATTAGEFIIEDTTGPIISGSVEFNGDCTEFEAWLESSAESEAFDACSASEDIVWTHSEVIAGDCSGIVDFMATDSCANETTMAVSYTISEGTAPVFTTVPTDMTVECDENSDAALDEWLENNGGAVAEHACGEVTHTFVSLSEDREGCSAVELFEFTATGVCGDSISATASFFIEDTTGPVLKTEPTPLFISCADFEAVDLWLSNDGGAVISDACGSTAHAFSELSYENDFEVLSGPCGETAVNFTVTDDCGEALLFSSSIATVDPTAPVWEPSVSDTTVECDINGENLATVALELFIEENSVATDNCSSSEDMIFENSVEFVDRICGAIYVISFTATDSCGNVGTESAEFMFEDTTGPIITVDPIVFDGECAEFQVWLDTAGGAVAEDACSASEDLVWTHSELTENCSGDVVFDAADSCGNTSSVSSSYTLGSGTSPVFTVLPTDMTIECDQEVDYFGMFEEWVASNGGAAANHPCGDVTISAEQESTDNDDCSIVSVWEFTAVGACGDPISATASFTIQDTTAPEMITEASPLVVDCDDSAEYDEWLSNYAGAVVIDACEVVSFENDLDEEDLVPCSDPTEVTFTASDACGNSITFISTITVTDSEDPTFEIEAISETVECDLNSEYTVEGFFDDFIERNAGAVAVDNCSSEIIITNDVSVVLNVDSSCTLSVNVVFTATDLCGNFATTETTFSAEDTVAPVMITDAFNFEGNCAEFSDYLENNGGAVAFDACSANESLVWELDSELAPIECGSVSTANFIVSDECGLIATTSAVYTITDTNLPQFTSEPEDITAECNEDTATAFDEWLAINGGAVVDETCGVATFTTSFIDFALGCSEANEVAFTVLSACGTTDTRLATFFVTDTVAPVMVTPPTPLIVPCNLYRDDVDEWLQSSAGAEFEDACSGESNFVFTNDFSFPIPASCNAVEVVFTSTDECGNSFEFTSTITVESDEPFIVTPTTPFTALTCDSLVNQIEFDNWLSTFGGAEVSASCGSVSLAMPSEMPSLPECGSEVEVLFETLSCGDTLTSLTVSGIFTIEPPLVIIGPAAAQKWSIYQFLCVSWDLTDIDFVANPTGTIYIDFGTEMADSFILLEDVDLTLGQAEIFLYAVTPGSARVELVFLDGHVEFSANMEIVLPTGDFADPCNEN